MATLSGLIGEKANERNRGNIERYGRDFHPDKSVVPEELAYTASETLPLFRRESLLDPVRPRPQILADAYYGNDYTSNLPDVYILPRDSRLVCLLSAGVGLFLSDGVTHHYALVDSVDYRRRIVTLLDPWAPVSFLLAGHNVLGIAAHGRTGRNGAPLLDLTFDELLLAVRGSIQALTPREMFQAFEKVYPELAGTQAYLNWKYSRLLASDDFTSSLMTTLQISEDPRLAADPNLALLRDWANDYTTGLMSGFSVPEMGRGAKPGEVPQLRAAFLRRLPSYAKTLSWPLKWLLLRRTDETDDVDLRMSIIDGFLAYDPHDTDFQIARAETLVRLGRLDEAAAQVQQGEQQWKADVGAAIALPTSEQAVDFLFKKDYGLDSLSVLHWRYQRLAFLRLIIDAQRPGGGNVDAPKRIDALQSKYVIGSVLIDFFPYVLRVASLTHDDGLESVAITTAAEVTAKRRDVADDDLKAHFARWLYEDFTTRRDIRTLPQATLAALRRSPLRGEVCAIAEDGRIILQMRKPLLDSLAAYCGLPAAH